MRKIASNVAVFLRWLFAPEQLPEQCSERRTADLRRGGFLSSALAPERLPEAGVAGRPAAWRRGFWGWLLSRESCPESSPARPRGPGFIVWLLSSETCSQHDAPRRNRHSSRFLRGLNGPEGSRE